MAQMKYANSASAGGHLGSGIAGFSSSFSATKQIEGEILCTCFCDGCLMFFID